MKPRLSPILRNPLSRQKACRNADAFARGPAGCPPLLRRGVAWARANCPYPKYSVVLLFTLLCAGLFSTGFWTAGQGRQVTAIRMGMDHNAYKLEDKVTSSETNASGPGWVYGGRTTYRATLQDVSPRMFAAPDDAATEYTPAPGLLALAEGDVRIAGITGHSASDRLQERSGRLPQSADPEEITAFLLSAPQIRPSHLHPETRLEELARECRVAPALFADGLSRIMGRLGVPVATLPDKRFSRYQTLVEENARRYNLSASLIYAIMRTESAFNPFAVSASGALGLMQLIPDTAGVEAHNYITGKAENPTHSLLFDPDHNIRYGSAYLHLLHTRYFPAVQNPASRELCVIAAYNGGPNAVLKIFDPNKDAALAAINALTPEQVYARLTKDMPSDQNRRYVDKVLGYLRGMPDES